MRTSDVFASHELLPALVAFIVVVESGGYSAGARRTRTDKATLSRRVRSLEDALEVRLLDRTTRTVHMTEAGRALFEQTAERLRDVLLALGHVRDTPGQSGRVRATTVPGLETSMWAPVLLALKKQYPDIDVILTSDSAFQRLVAAGLDLGIRAGNIPTTNEIAKKLATWRYVMVASPTWRAHPPEADWPSADSAHWLLYGNVTNATQWSFERNKETLNLELMPSMLSNDNALLRELALQGAGVFITAPPIIDNDLVEGRLVRVFPDWRIAHTHSFYSVVPHREYVPGAVRIVVNAVEERFAALETKWRRLTD